MERSPLSKYRESEYHTVRLGDEIDAEGRRQAVAYAEQQVGRPFGYLAALSAIAWLLFGWRLELARHDHQICSGLVVHALQEGGLLDDLDATFALPADLAKRYGVRP